MHYIKEHDPIKKNIKTKHHIQHTPSHPAEQTNSTTMHLMAQQAMYRMSLNEEMFSKNLALSLKIKNTKKKSTHGLKK